MDLLKKYYKYILLGILLSVFVFLASDGLYASYYKDEMFSSEENISYIVKLNTKDVKKLVKFEEILKEYADNNYSIIVHNNPEFEDIRMEYNFYSNLAETSSKIITYSKIKFDQDYEIKTGDNILFDPSPKNPILIKSINFPSMSTEAVIVLLPKEGHTDINSIINSINTKIGSEGLVNDLVISEFFDEHDNHSSFYLLQYHFFIFLIIFLIIIFIIKDVNSSFKEISLMKIEGFSNANIFYEFIAKRVAVVVFSTIPVIFILVKYNYNIDYKLVPVFYNTLAKHYSISIGVLVLISFAINAIIINTSIHQTIKGYTQLESSILIQSLLKIVILSILLVFSVRYLKIIPKTIQSEFNLAENKDKYEDSYIIRSSLSPEVNQIDQIERIQKELVENHKGFYTVCLPEGEDEFLIPDQTGEPPEYKSIYYYIRSNQDLISIDNNRELDETNQLTFNHYNLDDLEIQRTILRGKEYLYCPGMGGRIYSSPIYMKQFNTIKIELEDFYSRGLDPAYIIFKANSLNDAKSIVDKLYSNFNEDNLLYVESVDEIINIEREIAIEEFKEAIINLVLMFILLIILNYELIDNFIVYYKEESVSLILLGKSNLFLMRKYLLSTAAIYLALVILMSILYFRFSYSIQPVIFIIFLILELITVVLYYLKVSLRKLKG